MYYFLMISQQKQAIMRFKTLLLIFTIIATVGTADVKAQDFHFTQFDMSPLTLNPALTGAYEGTFRIGGVYRDQWASVLGNPFRTPSFYIDAPIIRGFRSSDWIGVGISVLSDQVGAYNYQNTVMGASLAYHIGVGKTTISIGGQYNNVSRRVDRTLIEMADNWDSSTGGFLGISSDATNFAENSSFADISAGINLSTPLSDKVKLNAGVSAGHLNAPVDGFQATEALDVRVTAHAKADIDLNAKWVLTPTLLFQTLGNAQEVNGALMIGYRVKDNFLLQYGQGWRVGDATNAILAIQYDRLRAGISYDINISDLNSISNSQGGFELGVSYIARIFSEPKSKPVIFCPRF